jgi:hypothetical protein
MYDDNTHKKEVFSIDSRVEIGNFFSVIKTIKWKLIIQVS